ncbi:putative metal-dependent hydrolase [Deinococcus detaillensis]|uniref:Putative metal-dependent hydrolase FNU79_01325 n=1 Tax=Deinococcus detaillensis TaxID=2592048 RepID=A0A553V666_9DEIO|nr:putative metal-dependent hydrolase [Deinococcus detaillensis]TSA87914.1 putative metal-dependent hydrolase [Deinococcus detaillensis]
MTTPPDTALSFAAASARVDAYVSQFKEGYFPPLLLLARLSEEVGEVARVLSHENGKTPKAGEDVGDLELELADALFVMLCMTNSRGLSLERGFERMMQKVETRDAQRWTKKEAASPRTFLTDPRYPVGPMPVPGEVSLQARAEAVEAIRALPAELRSAAANLSDAQLDTPYREGGWTLRQVVHHVADSHLNAYARLKWALTEERPTIKPYQESQWAGFADSALPVEVSLVLLDSLHQRWVAVLESLDEAQWAREFVHPVSGEVLSVAQAALRYQWHGQHHTAHLLRLRQAQGWPLR